MRTDDSAPGGEKVVHVAQFFPQKLSCSVPYTVLSEIILKQFLPASHPGKISRLTTCLSSSCWYSLQKIRYSTKQLNSIRKEGSPSKKSLNFIKMLGFWLVNTPNPGMSGMSGTSNNFYIISQYSLQKVQYSTKQLNSSRRGGSPSIKSLNFIKILGFWLVNTPDLWKKTLKLTNIILHAPKNSGAYPLAPIYSSDQIKGSRRARVGLVKLDRF